MSALLIDNKPCTLGGNRKAKIYGQLTCPAANAALAKGYAQHRVFFADEAAAIAAGYRRSCNSSSKRIRN